MDCKLTIYWRTKIKKSAKYSLFKLATLEHGQTGDQSGSTNGNTGGYINNT
jgi:hypothetical protein